MLSVFHSFWGYYNTCLYISRRGKGNAGGKSPRLSCHQGPPIPTSSALAPTETYPHIDRDPLSSLHSYATGRARTRPQTIAAPAAKSGPAQASNVAPVVQTSSLMQVTTEAF